jgi:hypothetical protein
MWNEWLARTLRPRPAQSAALMPMPVPPSTVIEEIGIDGLRPPAGVLRAPAQNDEESSLAVEV